MSSERGNVSRTRPQRHQNARAFRNDKYDTSARRKVGGGEPRPARGARGCPGARSRPSAGDASPGAGAAGRVSCRKRGLVSLRSLEPYPAPVRSGARTDRLRDHKGSHATEDAEKINAKLHDGVCQHCKGILEWRVKFRKYKLLTKPKKCVKCLQKTVKDPYHIICRPCAGKLEICAKCGKQEEIVIPIDKGQERADSDTSKNGQESSKLKDELDFETNFSSADSDEDSDVLEEQFKTMNFETTEI